MFQNRWIISWLPVKVSEMEKNEKYKETLRQTLRTIFSYTDCKCIDNFVAAQINIMVE